jgi:hypothetical protein
MAVCEVLAAMIAALIKAANTAFAEPLALERAAR